MTEDELDDMETKLQSDLGFCGCGAPDQSLEFIFDVLRYIDRINTQVHEDKMTWTEWEEEGKQLFACDGARWFTFYWLDSKDFTEHGGSVPGWITDEGRAFMATVEELYRDQRVS